MKGDDRSKGELTRLLQAWNLGDFDARDELIPLVFHELRRRAVSFLRREGPGATLCPTELVNEAYLRLSSQSSVFQNRDQFFGIASQLMRRILVDRARARHAAKRAAGLRVTWSDQIAPTPEPSVDLLELEAALVELGKLDPRQVRLVELRFFTGLTLAEAARVLQISLATANRDWAMAKAWLFQRLSPDSR